MANNQPTAGGYYPPAAFRFKVQFSGLSDDNEMRFQSIGGLSSEVEMETFKEGGSNMFVYQLPVRIKFSDISLKRGLLVGSDATKWMLDAMNSFTFSPKNLSITLMDDSGDPLMTWDLYAALPKKWSVSEFNAEQSALVIEQLDLVVRDFNVRTGS